jgi:hypothetical protein
MLAQFADKDAQRIPAVYIIEITAARTTTKPKNRRF